MTARRSMARATTLATACLLLAGCTGLANVEQESVYHDDRRIAQEPDTYSIVNSRGSVFDRHIGEHTGLETWLRLTAPEEGGEFRIEYDVDVSAGEFKIVLVDGESVDTVCEGTDEGSRTFALEQGDYELKAVGNRAGADIALELRATEGVVAVDPDGPLGDAREVELEPLENR